jgi:hypothetical protein
MGLSNKWLGFCGYCEKICDEYYTIVTECQTVLCEDCAKEQHTRGLRRQARRNLLLFNRLRTRT